MRKPSIFSKDYEKIMRKRRRIFVVSISFFILTSSCLVLSAVKLKNINGNRNLVSLIKEDSSINENIEGTNKEHIDKTGVIGVNTDKNNNIDIFLNNNLITLLCSEIDGDKIINNIIKNDNIIFYKLDYTKKKVVVIDKNQDMFLCDVNGQVKNLSLKEYVAPNGDVYDKNTNISTYNNYLWHSQCFFIDDKRIAYVSNLPYFGYDLNQYVQIVNIDNGIHETLWWTKGYNILLKESESGGLEASIDGNIKYIK